MGESLPEAASQSAARGGVQSAAPFLTDLGSGSFWVTRLPRGGFLIQTASQEVTSLVGGSEPRPLQGSPSCAQLQVRNLPELREPASQQVRNWKQGSPQPSPTCRMLCSLQWFHIVPNHPAT